MKLLIITQKVDENDSNLGFFINWLEKLAQKLEQVDVICLAQGKHNLPDNVRVFSLGKEQGFSKTRQFFRLQKFLWRQLKQVDGVFVHMCPIYAVAAYPLVRLSDKRMFLWFLHKEANWKLKLAGKLSNKILTASEESCQLKNREKIKVLGQGIDIERFRPSTIGQGLAKFKILFVGRISPIKDLETLIKAADILVKQKKFRDVEIQRDFEIEVVGAPIDKEEKEYEKRIKQLVKEKGLEKQVKFLGGISHQQTPRFYQQADVVVNLCPTGGMDKAVLEAMACGCLVLAANHTFKKEFGLYSNSLFFEHGQPADLAEKIIGLSNLEQGKRGKVREHLRQRVAQHHNLDGLILKIINEF